MYRSGTVANKAYQVTFVKGKSGNPEGRPKEAKEVKEYARQFTKEAVDRLVSFMRQDSDIKTAKAAADSILDRAIGKPSQSVELDDSKSTIAAAILEIVQASKK